VNIPGEFLDKDELRVLTDTPKANAQAQWLSSHGIPHLVDGKRVIVSRVHVRARLEGRSVVSSCEPKFDRPF
jgi:hypothetical protein